MTNTYTRIARVVIKLLRRSAGIHGILAISNNHAASEGCNKSIVPNTSELVKFDRGRFSAQLEPVVRTPMSQ